MYNINQQYKIINMFQNTSYNINNNNSHGRVYIFYIWFCILIFIAFNVKYNKIQLFYYTI